MPRNLTMIRIEEGAFELEEADAGFDERMGALFEEITKAGVMLETAGLKPTKEGKRVVWEGGKISYTDGPFTETKEVVGGYSISQCRDLAEAVEWSKRFLEIHPPQWKVTCEVREIEEM
jgi:hypothetical protein